MSTLMDCNAQWSTRPNDERYLSLDDMQAHFDNMRERSRAVAVSTRDVQVVPLTGNNRALRLVGPKGNGFAPTHYAFGQLATIAGAPAGYLRTLPAPMAADCINYGLQVNRDAEDIGLLLYSNGAPILRAATGPRYGRIWNGGNDGVVQALRDRFGDGVTGRFRVPGEFGQRVDITKENTTLFAGDRDMFVFLADEENRIEVPNRRDGHSGSMARGFFVWNSEVGARTLGIKTFLFDYVCCNRIVWGANDVQTFTLRHTHSAPHKFIEEVRPMLQSYANSSAANVTRAIADARQHRLDNVDAFLAKRFGARMVEQVKAAHLTDEGRPIETRWDVVTAVTAHARSIAFQDARVDLETQAGELLTTA